MRVGICACIALPSLTDSIEGRPPDMSNEELHGSASDQLSLGEAPKFLCGVAVSVYQNSGTACVNCTASAPGASAPCGCG